MFHPLCEHIAVWVLLRDKNQILPQVPILLWYWTGTLQKCEEMFGIHSHLVCSVFLQLWSTLYTAIEWIPRKSIFMTRSHMTIISIISESDFDNIIEWMLKTWLDIPLANPLPMYPYQIDQMMEELSLCCKSSSTGRCSWIMKHLYLWLAMCVFLLKIGSWWVTTEWWL